MLVRGMEVPVGVEIAVVDQGAESEDGFGTGESPADAGDVEAVTDQVSAGAFDRRWRSASPRRGRCRSGAARGGRSDSGGRHPRPLDGWHAGRPGQLGWTSPGRRGRLDPRGSWSDGGRPRRLPRGAGLVECVGRRPDVLGDVHEVQEHVDRAAAVSGFALDQVALVAGAVDQDDPAPVVTPAPRSGPRSGARPTPTTSARHALWSPSPPGPTARKLTRTRPSGCRPRPTPAAPISPTGCPPSCAGS